MKTTKLLMIAAVAAMVSCATLTKTSNTHGFGNATPACKSPIYIITVAKTAAELNNDLSLYALTKWAQANMGSEVSVQNIYWEERGGRKINVVFDVVRCNPEGK